MTDCRLSNEELVAARSLWKAVQDETRGVGIDGAGDLRSPISHENFERFAYRNWSRLLDHIATLQREADEARESLARWMLDNSFATGHGDTISDLISELKFQLEEQKARTHEMREALSGILDLIDQEENTFLICERCGFQHDDWLKDSDLVFLLEPLRERARAALKALPPQQDADEVSSQEEK
jgi:RNA polymerase-binding transcription factor DksA